MVLTVIPSQKLTSCKNGAVNGTKLKSIMLGFPLMAWTLVMNLMSIEELLQKLVENWQTQI
jgi:hypothetical protein